MSTIVTINSGDLITNSRADLNTNFANLNADKIETSVLDTDTALAANSDAKIPSQKAVKAYVDTLGNVNASETARGIVEEATDAEVTAGTATGGTGAKLFVTPAKLATRLAGISSPVVNVYTSSNTWSKPAGLKYVVVEVVGGGGGSGGSGGSGDYSGGGGSGGYSKKKILAASLGSTETVTVGTGGAGSVSSVTDGTGGVTSSFGTHATATGGAGSTAATGSAPTVTNGGTGGTGASGDLNIDGHWGQAGGAHGQGVGYGALSFYGQYGRGGNGKENGNGNAGAAGIVIVTEYYV